MKTKHCENCNQITEHKRIIGIGTLIMIVLTGGVWLLFIPFYDIRCIKCGTLYRRRQTDIIVNNIKKCPFCAEYVKAEALICRFCNKELEVEIPPEKAKKLERKPQPHYSG